MLAETTHSQKTESHTRQAAHVVAVRSGLIGLPVAAVVPINPYRKTYKYLFPLPNHTHPDTWSASLYKCGGCYVLAH